MRGILFGMALCGLALQVPPVAGAADGLLPSALITHATRTKNPPADAKAGSAAPNAVPVLTLDEAEVRAIEHEPRLLGQQFREQAAGRRTGEALSAYFPQMIGNLTGVRANGDTAVASGAVTTSSISTRAAFGMTLVQLVTDFGRTNDLVHSARLTEQASGQGTAALWQQVLRNVDEAFFALEAAQSVARTAQAVLDFRRVSLRQLTALAQSQLRSTLDVQFAQVLVSEAELAVVRAGDNVTEAQAQLTAAMGDENDSSYVLADAPLPPEPGRDVSIYMRQALHDRPDLRAVQLQAQAAHQFALAERKLNFPTLNVLGAAGEVPEHDVTIPRDYGAIGVNLSIPVFNGRLYSERAAAAKLEAKADNEDVSALSVAIARDVKMAWARSRDTYLQIQVAERLVSESNEAMRLAQARYNAGLGSIVELDEAELNQTSALITAAGARFDYQRAQTELNYTLGNLH